MTCFIPYPTKTGDRSALIGRGIILGFLRAVGVRGSTPAPHGVLYYNLYQ
jgi:hypothetical protein